MASSSKKSKASTNNASIDQPQEDPLVAVILADSYDNHFTPLTLTWPRCLLTIANVPLLNYSVESASRTGVDHIYILTKSHAQLIKKHVQDELQGYLKSQGISITIISTPEAQSEGDAMRELDAKQILRSDFILFRSDSICTLNLSSILEKHKKRRALDKDAIMTICCTSTSKVNTNSLQTTHFIDPSNLQLLHYQTMANQSSRSVLPLELLRLDEKTGCEEIDIRNDLIDSGVYICSMEVPPLFSENFDYQSLTLDFIPGILTSDLLDSKIFIQIYKNGYAKRAQDTKSYHEISKDILQRWTYPLTPSCNSWIGPKMIERQGWRYIGKECKIDRNSEIQSCSMIGENCQIDSQTLISSSVIGDNVQIGKNCKINESHIHSDAIIGNKIEMSFCIIGKGVQILDNVQLGKGCLIGANCVIGPNVSLSEGTRIGIKSKKEWHEDDESENLEESVAITTDSNLGSKSRGAKWPNLWQKRTINDTQSDEDDDEEEDSTESLQNLRQRAIGYIENLENTDDDSSSVSSIEVDSELESDIDDETSSGIQSINTQEKGITNLTLEDKGETQIEKQAINSRLKEFEIEAKASLSRALEENHNIENTNLELKTLRMASNVAPKEVHKVVLQTLLDKCDISNSKQISNLISQWGKLIPQNQLEDQLYTIIILQIYCCSKISLFVPMIKLFYNQDIISDESLLSWFKSKSSQQSNLVKDQSIFLDLRNRSKSIIQYILENQDDDDESEEE